MNHKAIGFATIGAALALMGYFHVDTLAIIVVAIVGFIAISES